MSDRTEQAARDLKAAETAVNQAVSNFNYARGAYDMSVKMDADPPRATHPPPPSGLTDAFESQS